LVSGLRKSESLLYYNRIRAVIYFIYKTYKSILVLYLKNNLIFYAVKIVARTLYTVFYSEFLKDFDENSLMFQ